MRKSIIISLLLTITMWSCIEGDPLHDITGARINNGGIYLDTLYAISDTSIVEGKVSTAFGAKLLLGSYADFETRFLIRFTKIPADSFKIDSLRLILSSLSNQGETLLPLTGSTYMVTEDWEESVNENEDWDWQDKIDKSPETSANFELRDESGTTHVIELPPVLMNTWQDTTAGGNNFGLLVDFNNASYIKEFGSSNYSSSGLRPKLVAVYYDASLDSTIHDTLFVDKDASLIDFTGSFDPALIKIASGYSVKAFFKFDLNTIPKNAALATMRFILNRDVDNSVINSNISEKMYLRTATTDFNSLPFYEVDSTFVLSFFHNVSLSELSENVLDIPQAERGGVSQNFLQDIINGDISFGSFMVQYKNEWDGVSVYAVKDTKSSDINLRPKIIIEYYDIPNPRL
ncbi:MAG: hypothetical protein KAS58_05645 [Calditrichia bacterium]|nr:hypothetical protein [Calditrichia bacterium]